MYESQQQGLTTAAAIEKAGEVFHDKPEIVHMIKGVMNIKEEKLTWLANVDSIYSNFLNVTFFDESLRYPKTTVYHLVGEKSVAYKFSDYLDVFP